jgi:tetratricopeptide (TPR) repeat protein
MDLPGSVAAKAKANEAFAAARFIEADSLYTQALALLADVPVPVTGAAAAAKAALALAAREAADTLGAGSSAESGGANGSAFGNGNGVNGHAGGDEDDEDDDGAADDGGSVVSAGSVASGVSDGSVYPGPAEDGLGSERREVSEEAHAKAVLLANRSMTRIRLEQYGFAINDADDALALDPAYTKSLYRRGAALFALGNVASARKDFREICRRLPAERDARAKLAECEKVLREERFAQALDVGGYESDGSVGSGGSGVSACDSVDLNTLVVEEGYAGPAPAEGGAVDAEFVRRLIDCFRGQGKLHYKYAVTIMLQAKALFDAMPNIVEVPVPSGSKITVCGDVHGQFYDLVDSIFAKNGMPSAENPYVFNGDFVDRGSFSVEVILLLLSLKVACPESIHLTRGNHESVNMNKSTCCRAARDGSDVSARVRVHPALCASGSLTVPPSLPSAFPRAAPQSTGSRGRSRRNIRGRSCSACSPNCSSPCRWATSWTGRWTARRRAGARLSCTAASSPRTASPSPSCRRSTEGGSRTTGSWPRCCGRTRRTPRGGARPSAGSASRLART